MILVVEDELSMRELMKTCLEFEGFDVITAADGLEGLRRYEENKDQVQVVVTDLDTPADEWVRHDPPNFQDHACHQSNCREREVLRQ